MNRLTMATALLLLSALPAQQDNGLVLRPDADNQVAAALGGRWRADEALGRRVGATLGAAVEFVVDETALARVPAAAAKHLRGQRIYQAGTATVQGDKQVYVLGVDSGMPAVFLMAERAGVVAEEPRMLRVALVFGPHKDADLLFLQVAGDERKTGGAFARATAVAALTPLAAVEDMRRLMLAKDYLGMLRVYVSPIDRKRWETSGDTIEKIAEQFAGDKAAQFLEMLDRAVKMDPKLSDDGEAATWEFEAARPLTLLRIDGRWYVKN